MANPRVIVYESWIVTHPQRYDILRDSTVAMDGRKYELRELRGKVEVK